MSSSPGVASWQVGYIKVSSQPNATVLVDLTAATMDGVSGFGLIPDAALVLRGETIVAIGSRSDIAVPEDADVRSMGGRLVTPGLIDCHTHLVFGGNRSSEFEARLSGVTYEEIAASGGGIRSTVRATRAASEEELLASAQRRLDRLHHTGATTVEIKSGYGLDLDSELKMLRVGRRLGDRLGPDVTTTLLAAHVVADEFDGDGDAYVQHIIDTILPAAVDQNLADAVDVFCEHLAFTPHQTDRIFTAAHHRGLPVKVHGAQLSANGGVEVAASHGAMSADHLEHVTAEEIQAMERSGTVAVLIPGATHTLQVSARPPVGALRRFGVPMAIASDLNPGTSPVADLALVCNLAALLLGLTPEEAVAGVTREAARALRLEDRGRLVPGLRADLAFWDAEHPAELVYWAGMDLCSAVWVAGVPSFDRAH